MRAHHSLRASDSDRDAVVDRLRVAAGEGRLEPHELEQRVDGALRARTYGDLARLVADLPGAGGARRRRTPARRVAESAALGAGLLAAVTVAVVLVAVVVVVMMATAAWWLAFVLFWMVCCGSRRRLVWGPARRRSLHGRHARRTAFL